MALSSLLKMLVQNDGDQVVIVLGERPALSRAGVPIRMFFPEVTPALHDQLLGTLLTDARRAALEAGEEVRWVYDDPQVGPFRVVLSGTPRAKATLRRGREDAPAPAPAPAPVEAPSAPSPSSAPAPVVGGRPALPRDLIRLLARVIDAGGSDLHLAAGEPPVWRVDGRLSRVPRCEPVDANTLIWPLLSPEERDQVLAGRGLDLGLRLPTGERIRVHVFLCDQGVSVALRILRRRAPHLHELGLPVPLDDLPRLSQGLVLVCGPTGSGKSTTIAGMVQASLHAHGGLLVTLEDPIEYVFEADGAGALVRQRQVGTHVPDFPSGLRDALREDPDLILVGEMRDAASIKLALTAAETGHLVFASIHARSAASSVTRIVDGHPAEEQAEVRVQLAESLRAVVVQRLLPRASGSGRVLALEVMRVTRPIAAHIREGRDSQIPSAIQAGAADGMIPLERCLRDLVRDGKITRDVARACANDPQSLQAYLR